jgi:ubiquinone/menaquinone biosynthesis C-methylase UbiE
MRRMLVPERRFDDELMDAPGLPPDEVADAYRVLQRVNRQLGNLWTLRREWFRFVREEGIDPGQPVTVLDVGGGSGDVAGFFRRILAKSHPAGLVFSLDRDPVASSLARQSGEAAVQGDALRLPFADRSIDLVTAVKFAHHFHDEGLQILIGEMARVASRRVVVLDIERHLFAYWGFIAWSRVFTSNRLVRYDGPLSVLRGFTRDELMVTTRDLSAFSWKVRSYPGWQLALVGTRRG